MLGLAAGGRCKHTAGSALSTSGNCAELSSHSLGKGWRTGSATPILGLKISDQA